MLTAESTSECETLERQDAEPEIISDEHSNKRPSKKPKRARKQLVQDDDASATEESANPLPVADVGSGVIDLTVLDGDSTSDLEGLYASGPGKRGWLDKF